MGENLEMEGRKSVRTPVQWSNEKSGGFFMSYPSGLPLAVVEGGEFGSEAANAADQRRGPESLLDWMERLIRRRRECPEFGRGTRRSIENNDPAVLAHRCDWEDGTVIAVHNFSEKLRPVALEIEGPIASFSSICSATLSKHRLRAVR